MKSRNLLPTLLMVPAMASAQVNINIDAAQRGPKISPTHYGIFFEDINHAADGGIYAELIRNRSFEDGPNYGAPADMQGWKAVAQQPGQINARLIQPSKKTPLLNKAQGNAVELNINATAEQPACLINEGFWGINAVQGRTYRLSFWMKGQFKGIIKARLFNGDKVYAETEVSPYGMREKKGFTIKNWTKYTAELKADDSDAKASFALVFEGKGTLQFDMVSLFPPTWRNRENGLRPDLAQMLWNLHPKFMRFPGGCFVEGQISPDNAFRWERTIGPIEERTGHWNVNWGYRTTDGIGFHEYLQMAEDLGAKPLYVVNVGLWHGGLTPVEELQPWIDECLGALEYANGPVTSKYGAMRARNGHPEPFNLEYLEIGNENNQPDPTQQSDRYYERFKAFKDAVLARYPNIHLIGNVAAWGTDDPTWDTTEEVELLDEHYYRTPAWFANNFHKYDTYERGKSKIYVGEYAVTNGFGDLGNMIAALGEAVFMMGMENNSDVVPLNSYAPIFVNENDAKWRPDMIRFSSSRVMGTPSYYVQALMAQNVGTQVVPVTMENPYKATYLAQNMTPKKSLSGVATWGTKATFSTNGGKFKPRTGQWTNNNDGTISQKSLDQQCIAIDTQNVIDSDHYTINYRARKDSGDEGFIIVFNYVDDNNYCWLNLGGWGNSQHAIEQAVNGGKMQTAMKAGSVETGRWYNVRLNVEGDHVKCWLDDELIFDTQLKHDTAADVFASATIDEANNELIVKIVNSLNTSTTATLDLKNFRAHEARVIRLQANGGMDENTLENPTNIHPVETSLSPNENSVLVDIPANSLNIVRIK